MIGTLLLGALLAAPASAVTTMTPVPVATPAGRAAGTTATANPAFRFSSVEGGGGLPLNVVETGNPDGPAILFVHGMSQSYLAWLPQLRSSLAKTHRLVAFDLRGHGGSAKPWRPEDYADSKLWADDIAAVIAATKLERQPGPETEQLMAGSRLRASRDLEQNIDGYRQMADGLTAKPLPEDLDRVAFLTGLMHPGYVRRAMLSLPTQNADLASRVDVPVLLSMGRHDREWPIAACEQVAAMLPDARLSVYEESGHFPSAEDSERFNVELAALVQRRRR